MSNLPYPQDKGKTHFPGCYRHPRHHNCAVEEVDRLRRQLDTAREALRHIASNPTMGEGDMKWRARRALAALDGEDKADADV